MTEIKGLKPCPFCGGNDLEIFDGAQIICQNDECNAIKSDPYDYCYPNIEQWNNRSIESEWERQYNHRMELDQKEVDELRAEIDELKKSRRWIPIGEHLPDEDGMDVNVLVNSSVAVCAWWDQDRKYFYDGEFDKIENVTHWLPLPSADVLE